MANSPLDDIALVDGFSLVLLCGLSEEAIPQLPILLTELRVTVGCWWLHRVFDRSRVFLDWNRAVSGSHIAGVVKVAAGIEFFVILSLVLVVGGTVVGLVGHFAWRIF